MISKVMVLSESESKVRVSVALIERINSQAEKAALSTQIIQPLFKNSFDC